MATRNKHVHQLALENFDAPVFRGQPEEQEARGKRLAELEPIIQKVYGPAADTATEKLHHAESDEWRSNGAEMVRFLPRKVQMIESVLAERELWITVGTAAQARSRNLQTHRHIRPSIADRLLDLTSKLNHFAIGMELRQSQTRKHSPDNSMSWK